MKSHPKHIIQKFRSFNSYTDHCPKFFIRESVPMETSSIIETLYKIKSGLNKGVLRSNLRGYQTIDSLNKHEEFNPLINVMNDFFNKKFETDITIFNMWGNINGKGSTNETHVHHLFGLEYDYFSAVYYLQFQGDMGGLYFSDFLTMTHLPVEDIKPCDLVIFPNYMPHYVGANMTENDRISIAFNFQFKI